jgi:hypothetical protein
MKVAEGVGVSKNLTRSPKHHQRRKKMGVLSDPTIRSIFQNLTRTIFPLADWLSSRNASGGYVPPIPDLPWRKPGAPPLSIDDLKVDDFFEALLADDRDTALAKRWNTFIANPPEFARPDPTGWRTSRGLNATPKFGILDSDNFTVSVVGDKTKIAMTRQQFYQAVWPAVSRVVAAESQPIDWVKLVNRLRTDDASLNWPSRPVPKASEFIRQFTNDCLYALLNFTNGLPPPWNAAVPIEVGEFRRPNQKVSAKQAADAVDAFVAKT